MLSIPILQNVRIIWGEDFIKIEGPLGSVTKRRGDVRLAIKDARLYLNTSEESKTHFYLSLIRSLMVGVVRGYKRRLRLVGVGYRASVSSKGLLLKIGYSHEIVYPIPSDVQVLCSKTKGTLLIVRGIELHRVRQIAAEIRSFHKPDAYKGKGIHDEAEVLRLKKGKREGK